MINGNPAEIFLQVHTEEDKFELHIDFTFGEEFANIQDEMVPYPSGKGQVCKTSMHRFESGRHLKRSLNRVIFFMLCLKQTISTDLHALLSRLHFIKPNFLPATCEKKQVPSSWFHC